MLKLRSCESVAFKLINHLPLNPVATINRCGVQGRRYGFDSPLPSDRNWIGKQQSCQTEESRSRAHDPAVGSLSGSGIHQTGSCLACMIPNFGMIPVREGLLFIKLGRPLA